MPQMIQPELVELSNGIPVILQHDEGAVAATYWWNRVGSVDEETKEAGFAHFLEHMLFKDAAAKESGTASTGQMAKTIESLGGDINAYTSFDQTVYHVTCAAQHWEKILTAFGAMAKPQKFFQLDFTREREVILEELRKTEDSPGRQLFQNLFTNTFKRHPYGRPVIGFRETLKAARLSDLQAFYRKHYTSSQMGIILVGPLQDSKGLRRRKLLQSLEKAFGSKILPKKTTKKSIRKYDPLEQTKITWDVKAFDVQTPTVSFSFRVPDLTHPDVPALDLLAGILGMGELSRLYQRLFYKKSLVTDVSAGLYIPKEPGMIYFQAEMDSADKIDPVLREMFDTLKEIANHGVSQEELTRIIIHIESERLYATQTADGIAGRLGFLQFIIGDLAFDNQYLEQLRNVTSEKISEVAKKYFHFTHLSGSILIPKSLGKYDMSGILTLAKKELNFRNSNLPSLKRTTQTTQQKITPIRLSSGMTVLYQYRPNSHVFSIHASLLGGIRLEEKSGLSHLLSLTWPKGTSLKTAHDVSTLVEGRAASVEGFSGRNSVGLQMTGLTRDWQPLTELFTELLLDPTFPTEEIQHSKRVTEDAIRSIEDHSSQLCSKLFLETLFQHHPYGRLTYGTLESIQSIDSTQLKACHQNWVSTHPMVISLSGSMQKETLDSWLEMLEKQSSIFIPNAPKLRSPTLATPHLQDEPHLIAPRWIERSLKREQCHLLIGGIGLRMHNQESYALKLLETLLGGQSGRLFIELREKKSLAYTVAPVSFEGLEKGYVGTYIACAPQKRQEATEGIAKVLETLARRGPTPQEMRRAREFFLGRRAMDLQGDPALASHYGLEALYQLPALTEEELTKKMNQITPKDIQNLCRKYYVEPHQVTSCVG